MSISGEFYKDAENPDWLITTLECSHGNEHKLFRSGFCLDRIKIRQIILGFGKTFNI